MLSSLFKFAIWLGIAGLIWYGMVRHESEPADEALSAQRQLCRAPIGWRLAALDPAFRLSESQALELISEAAEQWNKLSGQQLFVHDPEQGFPIVFQFDERQQQVAQRLLLRRNVQRYDEHLAVLQDQYQRQLAVVQQQNSRLQQLQQEYQQQLERLQAQGARQLPAGVQQQWRIIEEEQRVFLAQVEALKAEEQRLQQMITQRNSLLPEQQQQGTHELGVMQVREGGRQMMIFAFAGRQDLLVTLQHEFGHALGLPHSDDPNAVMHALLHSGQQGLTATDLHLWQSHCLQP